jgi:acyl-CoA hydrolase
MKASVNYVGNSSMIIGIRVESENIQTGAIKHCNSYFTMVSKTKMVRTKSPRPYSSSLEEVIHQLLETNFLEERKDRHEEVLITPQKKHWLLESTTMIELN